MIKTTEVLDWYGNPIPSDKIPRPQTGVQGEVGRDGKFYLRPWSANGKPGKRTALEDTPLVIYDSQGRVVYDYWRALPADANIQPGYVGFPDEEVLKGYFGQSYAQKGPLIERELNRKWIETTEDGQKYWRWNVVWHDRLPVKDVPELKVQPRRQCSVHLNRDSP